MNSMINVITMGHNIIRIGNSRGVIIPADILEKLGLTLRSAVDIELEDNRIVIQAKPRQGWEEAARRLHEEGGDEMLLPDCFDDDFCKSEWKW